MSFDLKSAQIKDIGEDLAPFDAEPQGKTHSG
jgi:hypothetical protein